MGPRPCVDVHIYPVVSGVLPHGFWIPATVVLWASGGMLGFCPVSGTFTKITFFFFLQHFSLLARELSRILSPLFFQKGRRTYISVIRKNKSASVGTVGGILAVLNFSVRCEGLAGGGAH